jgi:hypothetical protein
VQSVQALEAKAVEATMADIAKENPSLYTKLKEKLPASVTELNASVVKKLNETAPKTGGLIKPDAGDFDKVDTDVYREYFDLGI